MARRTTHRAAVAKLADAPALGAGGREAVWVRLPPAAPRGTAPTTEHSTQGLLPDGHRAGRRNAMHNAEPNGTGVPDGSVLAYVDETGQYDHVLRTARTLAREHDA